MNTSWLLYLILAIQPALTIAAYLAARFFYQTPIDNGFGITALLAGVRPGDVEIALGRIIERLGIEIDSCADIGG